MDKHFSVMSLIKNHLRVRRNDIHIPISYDFAMNLCKYYAESNIDLVALSVILHDLGWSAVEEAAIFESLPKKSPNHDKIIKFHEEEGIRLATILMKKINCSDHFIKEVCDIIKNHDTKNDPHSLDHKIVLDSNLLWRFTVVGVTLYSTWNKITPSQYMTFLGNEMIHHLHLKESQSLANKELNNSKKVLLFGVL